MTGDERGIESLGVVASLVDRLLVDFDVFDLLTELTERCAELLDVDAAGLLFADPFGKLTLMAATSEQARGLELLQLQAEEGPCMDAYASMRPVSVDDLAADLARWPTFVPAALDSGFASVHAVPMGAGGQALGALGLFGANPGSLEDSELVIAKTLADVACVAVLQERAPTPETIIPQLRSAFASRVVIEQAKGFLREILDVPVEDAFRVLRGYARARGEHLTDVARRLMTDRHSRPALVAALMEHARLGG